MLQPYSCRVRGGRRHHGPGRGGIGGVPCDHCADQRAHLHCAQHGMRLCLLCDFLVHGASEGAHRRTPLCQRCHAAAAAVRCAVHRESLCAHCKCAVRCDAEGHAWSPTSSYTGFPDPADLARILYLFDAPPAPAIQEPPETCVPDLVNVELMTKAVATGLPGQCIMSTNEKEILDLEKGPGQLTFGNDEHLTLATIGGTPVVHQDQDAAMQQQAASSAPATVPVTMLEQGSSQDMEARRKLKEKREQAMQRYKEKRKNRWFGKKVRYARRKVNADRQHRVNGRFTKPSIY